MNLRNRLIWIAVLTVAFAGVQLVASRRKAEREHVGFVSEKLMPLVKECAGSARGVLTLQLSLAPDGKLDAVVERLDVPASSELQGGELVDCLRERTRTLRLNMPLPGGPEQLELTLPIDAP